MAAIRDEELISAIQNRRQHIIKNSRCPSDAHLSFLLQRLTKAALRLRRVIRSSLTLKGFRALLENDLKLPHKTLNNEQHKKTVERKVDQVCASFLYSALK